MSSFHEEQTETQYISVMSFASNNDNIAEVFIKDEGFVWYAVLRYQRIPPRSIIIRDAYGCKCKSPRPYQPGQAYDGSITSCVFHLYNQLCQLMGIDPLETYKEAYDDHILTQDQFDAILVFAQWQGVEMITEWDHKVIDQVLVSVHEADMHQLAHALLEKLAFMHIYIFKTASPNV